MQPTFLKMILILGIAFGLTVPAFAAEEKFASKTEKSAASDVATNAVAPAPAQPSEIQGEISDIGKDYISVIYQRDTERGIEYEMLLPVDESTKFEHKNSLKELGVGDTVRIQFEDTTEEKANAEQLKRKVKVVNFVSPAPKKPPVAAEPGAE